MKYILILTILVFSPLAAQQQTAGPTVTHTFGVSGADARPETPLPGLPAGDDATATDRKSPALALLYSLLLPGMGELYAGDYSGGKYFTILEGGLVVALIGMDRYANWLQTDAFTYAAQHAGAQTNGKDDRYYVALGDYNDVNQYNAAQLRMRLPQNLYDPTGSYYWKWDNTADRNSYFDMKTTSDNRFNDARFIGAAIAVNHIVSAINAARIAVSHNKSLSQTSLIDVHAGVIGGLANPSGVMITFTRNF
ncbi:MAG TPA: hypothetical protein VMW43_08665 [Bacteroidota bacterium]|nr:hypothetical protein [Bacteroidota bacterium]